MSIPKDVKKFCHMNMEVYLRKSTYKIFSILDNKKSILKDVKNMSFDCGVLLTYI